MEFCGSALAALGVEVRKTITSMVVEAGGKNGIIPADQATFDYVDSRTHDAYEPMYSDDGSWYEVEYRVDVQKLEPLVAAPHSPDNRKTAHECSETCIDRVYIGSCTGGKMESFMAAAKLLHTAGQQVKVPIYLVPATQKVWADVYGLLVPGCDGRTAAEIFEAVGCITPASPSCAACLGGPKDTFARLNEPEVVVSTTTRNFPGRMGHKEGQIYLVSPYAAAASALLALSAIPGNFCRGIQCVQSAGLGNMLWQQLCTGRSA
ncbi:unnamed protein product [Ostreobium quekettii]|uniref:Aconitase/3-isopropylmalate dehydratase large subunit alpha/beta/alpha domain-containing protein n=1 Tax=Ostreobium quekettii TaxID=121088 RepID=A0A8S1J642_9CHLO|nr:unnamed protein product [Ostreobium quekettii]